MQNTDDINPILEMLKDELVNLQRKMSSFEEKMDILDRKVEESHKMLTSMMETMQQLGVVSQPYRKTDIKDKKPNDSAYS
jgi:cell division septum initiation protein DivIVA